ncbi:MAG TPA: zinc dependent phospholipase C family protein [Spirochaetota bacterium]|nr:zinc dependent phospholipase C family protein [Spirochaetota bacterium]
MPGIYTHNYIFRKALDSAVKGSGRSYLMKSIALMFSSPDHLKAGLTGAIGPNIFDYTNLFKTGGTYGNDISFYLHDRGYLSFIEKMLDVILESGDSRNEWTSIHRAYLMGYLSHIISDSIVHPYVFYSSGFPGKENSAGARFFRKGNLRFQYNIDNYFIYRDESFTPAELEVSAMVPSMKLKSERGIWISVRCLILESLRRDNPEIFTACFKGLEKGRIDGSIEKVPYIDRTVRNIPLCYRLKRTTDEKKIKFLDRMNENRVTYSDFFVRYPLPKRVDEDAMNLHQGRWQYPALQRGFRYDSVLHLVRDAVEKTLSAWEAVEGMIYSGGRPSLESLGILNAYTGEDGVFFSDMKTKDPVKLRV